MSYSSIAQTENLTQVSQVATIPDTPEALPLEKSNDFAKLRGYVVKITTPSTEFKTRELGGSHQRTSALGDRSVSVEEEPTVSFSNQVEEIDEEASCCFPCLMKWLTTCLGCLKICQKATSWEELSPVPLSAASKNWSPAFVNYISEEIMRPNSGVKLADLKCQHEKFIAECYIQPDISIDLAENYGFIVPSGLPSTTMVRPLFIRCSGVTSGDTVAQILEAARIIIGLPVKSLAEAEMLVLDALAKAKATYEDKTHVVLPFVIGHSLGGAYANAFAVKNHWGSMCFNALGLGIGARTFVGIRNWVRANESECMKHISMGVTGDFVTNDDWLIEKLVETPGYRIEIPRGTLHSPESIHCDYDIAFTRAMAGSLTSSSSSSSDESSSSSENALEVTLPS